MVKKKTKHVIKQHATRRLVYQYRMDTSFILQKRNQEIRQDKWKWKNKFPKSLGWSKDISEREIHNNKPSSRNKKNLK